MNGSDWGTRSARGSGRGRWGRGGGWRVGAPGWATSAPTPAPGPARPNPAADGHSLLPTHLCRVSRSQPGTSTTPPLLLAGNNPLVHTGLKQHNNKIPISAPPPHDGSELCVELFLSLSLCVCGACLPLPRMLSRDSVTGAWVIHGLPSRSLPKSFSNLGDVGIMRERECEAWCVPSVTERADATGFNSWVNLSKLETMRRNFPGERINTSERGIS